MRQWLEFSAAAAGGVLALVLPCLHRPPACQLSVLLRLCRLVCPPGKRPDPWSGAAHRCGQHGAAGCCVMAVTTHHSCQAGQQPQRPPLRGGFTLALMPWGAAPLLGLIAGGRLHTLLGGPGSSPCLPAAPRHMLMPLAASGARWTHWPAAAAPWQLQNRDPAGGALPELLLFLLLVLTGENFRVCCSCKRGLKVMGLCTVVVAVGPAAR